MPYFDILQHQRQFLKTLPRVRLSGAKTLKRLVAFVTHPGDFGVFGIVKIFPKE